MFGLKKSNLVKKHCEFCGNEVVNPYYTVIFPALYIIDGTNNQISNVDRKNQIVTFGVEQKLEYSFEIKPNIFAYAESATEHLLCSSDCEQKYINEHTAVFVNGQYPVYDMKKMSTFSPITIPSNSIGGEPQKCDYCKNNYKYNGRNWTIIPTIRSAKINGSYNQIPNIDGSKYNFVVSDLSEKSPVGHWYAYETSSNAKKAFFCSYDCAYELVTSKKVLIMVNSIMDKEMLGVIIKETELINQKLGNPIHRPSFFETIPG